MITYKSSDILQRASQLADLENSSFIGWNEQINLLNESYRKLYQIVINNNDKYYLKSIKLTELVPTETQRNNESRFFLPADFYQLCALQTEGTQERILRRSNGESPSNQRYDIANETLIVYGNADVRDLELVYYPVPKTLSTSAPDKKMTGVSADDTILDVNNNGFLCLTDDGDLYVYNAAKGTTTSPVALSVDIDDVVYALLGRKFAIVKTVDEVYYVDIVARTFWILADGFKVAKKDNELYFLEQGTDDTFTVYKESVYNTETQKFARVYATELAIELPDGYSLESSSVWTFTDNLDYVYIPYQKDGDFLRLWECSESDCKEFYEVSNEYKNTIINGDLYSINYDICVNGAKIINDSEFYSVIGFNKADGSTGYGVTVISNDDDVVVKSVFVDTELNFPNNFYFNYIAYMLAVAYKVKQNADYSGLTQQADAEELAFYDTLNRDSCNYTRITNVYSGGNW